MAIKVVQPYSLRTYMEGDEVAIVELFEKFYKNYGGFTPKTPEYWCWCCLRRPDVKEESIFLVSNLKSNKLVGYAVVGKSGTIWELVYDPESDGKEIITLLLEQATKYLSDQGASSINFTAPQQDQIISFACKKFGFTSSLPPKMYLSVLSLENFFFILANHKAKELMAYNESILFKVMHAPPNINSSVLLNTTSQKVTINNSNQEYSIQLQVDYFTLTSLLFGTISPVKAFIELKLRVRPLRKIFTMIKILSCLQIKTNWSFQMSEYG